MQTEPDNLDEAPQPARPRTVITDPDFTRPLKPVAELLTVPDFPKSALGENVDIGGYTGVVVEIVNQSLKVRSQEGVTKSFNVNGLRRIYGPVIRPDPIPEPPPEPPRAPVPSVPRRVFASEAPPPPPPPPRAEPVVEPDFTKRVKKISEFIGRTDYPRCLLGEHIEIGGYTGVVVQIVGRSLKVRSPAEITRSYNADALRKLHAQL
jgi:hypothetical protein